MPFKRFSKLLLKTLKTSLSGSSYPFFVENIIYRKHVKNKQVSFYIFENIYIIPVIFTFSYLRVEKELFWGQIFKLEILIDLHVLKSSESESHIFSVWSACVSVISITQKQITAES